MGVLGDDGPATLRELRTRGQLPPEEMIARYRLVCGPNRELLVHYLRERQPALDYNSLESLANYPGKLFWVDLERHHPSIDSLVLPAEIAQDWKRRLRTVTTTTRAHDGRRVQTRTARINYRECLTPVRAFSGWKRLTGSTSSQPRWDSPGPTPQALAESGVRLSTHRAPRPCVMRVRLG